MADLPRTRATPARYYLKLLIPRFPVVQSANAPHGFASRVRRFCFNGFDRWSLPAPRSPRTTPVAVRNSPPAPEHTIGPAPRAANRTARHNPRRSDIPSTRRGLQLDHRCRGGNGSAGLVIRRDSAPITECAGGRELPGQTVVAVFCVRGEGMRSVLVHNSDGPDGMVMTYVVPSCTCPSLRRVSGHTPNIADSCAL